MPIKSKEEIAFRYDNCIENQSHVEEIMLAMDEWSEQESIAFAEWIYQNDFQCDHGDWWTKNNNFPEAYTHAELYQLYKQQSKQ